MMPAVDMLLDGDSTETPLARPAPVMPPAQPLYQAAWSYTTGYDPTSGKKCYWDGDHRDSVDGQRRRGKLNLCIRPAISIPLGAMPAVKHVTDGDHRDSVDGQRRWGKLTLCIRGNIYTAGNDASGEACYWTGTNETQLAVSGAWVAEATRSLRRLKNIVS